MAYQLPPGSGSLMLLGVGVVSSGQVIVGDFGHLVKLGLLVEVPGASPAREPAPAPEPEAAAASELTEQLPETPALVDTSSTAKAEPVADAESEEHPFEGLPSVRAPGKGKLPTKRR